MIYEHKNKIKFRKIDYGDLGLLKELKDESWFGTHKISIVNLTDQTRWFEKITEDKDNLILIAFEGSQPVGLYKILNIDWINHHYDLSYDVFKKHRGKGYSYKILEAGVDFGFEILNMHRIDTEVLVNNVASHKTVLFAGFKLEGIRREAVYKCGEWIGSEFYGILYRDWIKLDRVKNYKGCCNVSYKPKDGK